MIGGLIVVLVGLPAPHSKDNLFGPGGGGGLAGVGGGGQGVGRGWEVGSRFGGKFRHCGSD